MIGRLAFENCERAVFESDCDGLTSGIDLPTLSSIQLGWSALTFKDISNSTLIMKSVPYRLN